MLLFLLPLYYVYTKIKKCIQALVYECILGCFGSDLRMDLILVWYEIVGIVVVGILIDVLAELESRGLLSFQGKCCPNFVK